MNWMMKIICDETNANQRLDRFCRKYFKNYSHITLKDIYHWLRKWLIKVNGERMPEWYMVAMKDQIVFHAIISEQLVDKKDLKQNSAYIEHRMHRQWLTWDKLILYEDKDRLVWNKPVGIVAHEWNKHTEDITMNQLLSCYVTKSLGHYDAKILSSEAIEPRNKVSSQPETFKPAFAFRLDKDTSWVLVSAKTYPALQHINALIRDHDITKEYLACIVWIPDLATISKNYGYELNAEAMLTISEPLFKWFSANSSRAHVFINEEKGQASATIISIEKTLEHDIIWPISLLKCQLLTGRMHQIRAHLAYIGYPVLGDIQYGMPTVNRLAHKNCAITRQLLHSYCYSFNGLNDESISIVAPIPSEIIALFGL